MELCFAAAGLSSVLPRRALPNHMPFTLSPLPNASRPNAVTFSRSDPGSKISRRRLWRSLALEDASPSAVVEESKMIMVDDDGKKFTLEARSLPDNPTVIEYVPVYLPDDQQNGNAVPVETSSSVDSSVIGNTEVPEASPDLPVVVGDAQVPAAGEQRDNVVASEEKPDVPVIVGDAVVSTVSERTENVVVSEEKPSSNEPSEIGYAEVSPSPEPENIAATLSKLDLELDSRDTFSVLAYGTGALVTVWFSSAVVGALDSLPLIPKLMEVVGVGFTIWFSYRYLIYKKNREELLAKVEDLKGQILGSCE